ncbi:MAG: AmmeMemoRadiSam system protein A [Candidatus Absconditabacterales bacterium]
MNEFQTTCLALAKASILEEFGLSDPKTIKLEDEQFSQKRACFVTLKMNDELRGCIGTIIPHTKLSQDIIINAKNAAFQDPRFNPLTMYEIENNKLTIGITILSPTHQKNFSNSTGLLEFLEKEHCGLIITFGYKQATFLPSVREELPDPQEFIFNLLNKAGITEQEFENEFSDFVFEIYYGDEFNENRKKIHG